MQKEDEAKARRKNCSHGENYSSRSKQVKSTK